MKRQLVLAYAIAMILSGCAHATPGQGLSKATYVEECRVVTEPEIAALFDRWNQALIAGSPGGVVANYAEHSILLPTMSNSPRFTAAEKEDYFHHFMAKGPSGKIDLSWISIGCNTATDAGLYTFTFQTGEQVSGRYSFTYRWDGTEWLISSHHSSALPE